MRERIQKKKSTFEYYQKKLDEILQNNDQKYKNLLNNELINLLELEKKEGKSGNLRKKIKERLKRLSSENFYENNLEKRNTPPERLVEQLRFINCHFPDIIKTDDTELPAYSQSYEND